MLLQVVIAREALVAELAREHLLCLRVHDTDMRQQLAAAQKFAAAENTREFGSLVDRDAMHAEAGGISEALGAVCAREQRLFVVDFLGVLDPLCLGPKGFRTLCASVQPPQLHVSARHMDLQLFIYCGGEAAVLAVPFGLSFQGCEICFISSL